MINRFEKYDKSTTITHNELTMFSSLVGNIDIYEDLMEYRCLIQSRATLEFQRRQTVKQIEILSAEKAAMIKRISDVTENGKIHFNDLKEPMKTELVNINKNIKTIREAITYGYKMVNRIKHMEHRIDSKMTKLTNLVHNPNLTKLAEDWKAKMEKENGKSE